MKDPFKLDFRLGVNFEDPIDDLVNGEMQSMKNVMPRGISDELIRRPSVTSTGRKTAIVDLFATEGITAATVIKFVKVFQFEGRTMLLFVTMSTFDQSHRLWIVDPVSNYQVYTIPQIEVPPGLVYFGRFVYIVFGPNALGYQLLKVQTQSPAPGWSVTSTVFAGTGNSNLFPKLVTSYAGRTAWGNFGNLGPRSLIWGDVIDPLTVGSGAFYGTTNRAVTLPGAFDDELKVITEVYLNAVGNKTQSVLLALTRDQCFIITGEPAQTTDSGSVLGTLQINRMNVAAGCPSPSTYAVSKFGSLWVGADDVWFMPLGGQPVPVGKKIASKLVSMNRQQRWQIHAVMDGDIYKLALTTEDQAWQWNTQLGTSGCVQQWWLDMRAGPPQSWKDARWFGPYEFKFVNDSSQVLSPIDPQQAGTFNMFIDETQAYGRGPLTLFNGENPNRILRGVRVASMGGDDAYDFSMEPAENREWQASTVYEVGDEVSTGRDFSGDAVMAVWRCTMAGTSDSVRPNFWDGASPLTESTVVWTLDRYTTSRSCIANDELFMELTTPEITGGDTGTMKMFQGVELSIRLENTILIELQASLDRGTSALDVAKSVGGDVGGIVLNSFVFGDTTTLNGAFSKTSMYIDNVTRTPAVGAVFRLVETARFFVPTLTFAGSVDNGGDEFQFVAIIQSAGYATMKDFLEVLNNAIYDSLINSGIGTLDAAQVRISGGSDEAHVEDDEIIGLAGSRSGSGGTALVMLAGAPGDNDGWSWLGASDTFRTSGVGNGFNFIPFYQWDQRQVGDMVLRDFRIKARPFKRRPE